MLTDEIAGEVRGKRILVTGGTGMIGASVVRRLAHMGASVVSCSLDDLPAPAPGVEQVKADLSSLETCRGLTDRVDMVAHVAGIKGSIVVTRARPASFFVPLLMMNTNLLEAARRSGIGRLVYTSSIGAYSSAEVFREEEDDFDKPPMDEYPGWAKRMAELQVRAYAAEHELDGYAVVRPCNVYGPGDNFDPANAMVIPSLMARVASGENPLSVWGDGSAVRDFAYVDDVADGIILALVKGTRGDFVNLGSGIGVTIKELVETLSGIVGCDYAFDATKPAGYPRRVMMIDRARDWLGYAPAVGLTEGLRRTWEWYLANKDTGDKRHNYFADKKG